MINSSGSRFLLFTIYLPMGLGSSHLWCTISVNLVVFGPHELLKQLQTYRHKWWPLTSTKSQLSLISSTLHIGLRCADASHAGLSANLPSLEAQSFHLIPTVPVDL
ncbi:unnamed protein product [Urochloa humidicola]